MMVKKMENVKDKLGIRKIIKKAKPTFVVKESKFSARVKARWRFPRGKHSKVRQEHRGRPAMPTVGYGSPKELKFLHPSGYKEILVKNKTDIMSINPAIEGAMISSTLGQKKKLELLELAKENGITVLNVKELSASIESMNNTFEERKNVKKSKLSEKTKKLSEKKKAAEIKAKKAAEEKAEDNEEDKDIKAKEEKKSAEKVLTKRQ